MESFLYRQLERRAAFQGWIPLGERKTPDCPACAHTRYGNGNPEATLCKKQLKLEQLDIFRGIEHYLVPGGAVSYSHSKDTNAQSWRLIQESVLV